MPERRIFFLGALEGGPDRRPRFPSSSFVVVVSRPPPPGWGRQPVRPGPWQERQMLDRSASGGDVHAAACLGASNYITFPITFPAIWKNLLGGTYFPFSLVFISCSGASLAIISATKSAAVFHWLSLRRQRRLSCSVALAAGARLHIFPTLFAFFHGSPAGRPMIAFVLEVPRQEFGGSFCGTSAGAPNA